MCVLVKEVQLAYSIAFGGNSPESPGSMLFMRSPKSTAPFWLQAVFSASDGCKGIPGGHDGLYSACVWCVCACVCVELTELTISSLIAAASSLSRWSGCVGVVLTFPDPAMSLTTIGRLQTHLQEWGQAGGGGEGRGGERQAKEGGRDEKN